LRRVCGLFLDASSPGVSICTFVPVKQVVVYLEEIPVASTHRLRDVGAQRQCLYFCPQFLSLVLLYQ
jgi:hypothetical protein